MDLASAYPNSAISAGAMAAIALVMVAVLAFWLAMVYVAAREPRKHQPSGPQPQASAHPPVTAPDDLAQDEHKPAAMTG